MNEIILTVPRTGSTYLGWCIYYHKYGVHKKTYIEPFHLPPSVTADQKYNFYDNVIKNLKNSDVPVLKLHNYHINELKEFNLYDKFYEKISNSKVILMLRKNFYDLCLSHAVAEKTNLWKHYNEMPTDLEIDVENFKKLLNHKCEDLKEMMINIKDYDLHKIVYYEDLAFDTQSDYALLELGPCNFIGNEIPYNKAPSYINIVKNYHELHSIAHQYFVDHETPLVDSETLTVKVDLR